MLFDAFGMTVSRTGTTPTPFGFVGGAQYQTDADSGLMLLGHRYYDASIGRFISEDPIQDGVNWYAYCGNNPLRGIDPSGLERIKLPGVRNSPGSGWSKDDSHKDKRSQRWVRGDDALDGTIGEPGKKGWEGKDHWHKYKRGNNGRWEKDKNQGDRGHIPPGGDVSVSDPKHEPLPYYACNPGGCGGGTYDPSQLPEWVKAGAIGIVGIGGVIITVLFPDIIIPLIAVKQATSR